MDIFSERLKALRLEKNLAVYALAKELDVKPPSIDRWEQNKADVKGQNLVKLARFFNVSADYLLGLTDRREPSEP